MTPERYLHDPHIQELLQTTRMTRGTIGERETLWHVHMISVGLQVCG
jgi:hypothetical protein